MGSLPLRQSDAAKWTKAAWGATALAGAAAVIIFVLPGSKVTVDPNGPENAGQAAAPEKARVHPTENLGPQNWAALATTMVALQDNQPELEQWWRTRQALIDKQNEELALEPSSESEAPRGQSFAPSWRFIGLMWNGLTPLAILQVDGTQQLAGVGEKPVANDEFVIDSIDAEKIVVSRRGSKYEIKREVSERGTTLTDASALADPSDGVFGDQTGSGRRAPTTTRPRNNRQ